MNNINDTRNKAYTMSVDPIKDLYPINYRINQPQLRVVGSDGNNIGVLNTSEALRLAQNEFMDLVLVNSTTSPPLARICNYEKFIYETKRNKKEQDRRNRENAIHLKEIQLKPNISDHDLDIKLNHARSWLADNCKVKIVVKFRGREIVYKSRGFEIINNFVERLGAKIDKAPDFNNNALIAMVSPATKVK